MSKSSKSSIWKSFVAIFTVMIFILSYVGLKLKIDSMKKEIVILNEKLALLNDSKTGLIARHQILTSEERITTIAINELGLDYYHAVPMVIKINKEEIEKIEDLINKKYEH